MRALQEAADYVPRPPQPLNVNPVALDRVTAYWETAEIERMLRERFGWGVKTRPVLNRHERRRARKVRA